MKTEQLPTRIESGIVYSHYDSRQVAAPQCVPMHGMSYILAGSLCMADVGKTRTFGAGSLLFYRKDCLTRFTKLPAENGPYRAITVVFDQPALQAFSQQYGVGYQQPYAATAAVLPLANSPVFQRFFDTLQAYCEGSLPAPLAKLKQQEALLLLLQTHPDLQNVLFDFGQPGKIDLEAFMRQNFRFNVELKQLAYLTGRSLATFKRDFAKVFHTSPTRWLYQKRLEEAHYLLQQEHKRPSDVYLEVGFESLAHFSYAFKQFFGCNPSSIRLATAAR